tara:strand:- start:66 stop:707 length:642 start_codon:yes stop_codon:yes gene_type:complete
MSTFKILKKGAMFGLDARIALAIFGALSVISGAALYSAIQSAKVETYRQYFSELGKATEQYYLDTGQPVTQYHAASVNAKQLIENTESLKGWSGPYISATSSPISVYFLRSELTQKLDNNINIEISLQQGSTWASNTTNQQCSSVGDVDCFTYIVFSSGNQASGATAVQNLYNMMDSEIDGGDGALAGTIRLLNYSSTLKYLAYKYRPRARKI